MNPTEHGCDALRSLATIIGGIAFITGTIAFILNSWPRRHRLNKQQGGGR